MQCVACRREHRLYRSLTAPVPRCPAAHRSLDQHYPNTRNRVAARIRQLTYTVRAPGGASALALGRLILVDCKSKDFTASLEHLESGVKLLTGGHYEESFTSPCVLSNVLSKYVSTVIVFDST